MKKLIGLIIMLFISSCSNLPQIDEDARYHQIAANTNGNFLSLFPSENSNWQCGLNNHLDEIVAQMQAHPRDSATGKRKILVSIHGGLNSISANVKRVEKHYNSALEDGYFPVFISWRSGAITTLYDRYFGVRNGVDRSKWVTIPSAPFYFVSDVLSGVAAIPESIWDQSANFYNSHKNNLSGFYEKDIQIRMRDFDLPDIYYTQRGKEKTPIEQVGYGVRQLIPGVVRVISTPLIEGMADKAWGVMRRRAKTLVYRQQDLTYRGVGQHFGGETISGELHQTINCENNGKYFEKDGGNGIVAQLFRAISELEDIQITLVGHSMGAIIANDIVNVFPKLPFNRIIHMASADSIRNLMEKTRPYLIDNPSTQFYNLMLHPTNEEQEQSAFGIAPEGSLLIWIDYLLENPETTLDRVSGRWENMKWVVPLLKSNRKNIHLKLFGLRQIMAYSDKPDEKFIEPINHGDFSDFKFWRPEFYWK